MSKSNAGSTDMISPMVEIDFSNLGTAASELSISEYDVLDHLNIRGSSDNAKFILAVKKILGVSLPTHANTFNAADDHTILWLGPNEWWKYDS